jgi:hypothetical protein
MERLRLDLRRWTIAGASAAVCSFCAQRWPLKPVCGRLWPFRRDHHDRKGPGSESHWHRNQAKCFLEKGSSGSWGRGFCRVAINGGPSPCCAAGASPSRTLLILSKTFALHDDDTAGGVFVRSGTSRISRRAGDASPARAILPRLFRVPMGSQRVLRVWFERNRLRARLCHGITSGGRTQVVSGTWRLASAGVPRDTRQPAGWKASRMQKSETCDFSLQKQASGEVAEWPIVQHWKCCVLETGPGVRIPPSPLGFEAVGVTR